MFWVAVHHEIVTKLGILLEFKPESCLLHLFDGLGRPEIILLNNLLVAARLLIAKIWKTQITPSISKWRFKCQYCLLMCKLTAIKSAKNGSENALRSLLCCLGKIYHILELS